MSLLFGKKRKVLTDWYMKTCSFMPFCHETLSVLQVSAMDLLVPGAVWGQASLFFCYETFFVLQVVGALVSGTLSFMLFCP